jgi:hypothetical protein
MAVALNGQRNTLRHACCDLLAEGVGIKTLARELHLSRQTLGRWLDSEDVETARALRDERIGELLDRARAARADILQAELARRRQTLEALRPRA